MPWAPVRYAADVENLMSDEAKTIDDLNETFDTILQTFADNSGDAVWSVHAKSQGILKGVLKVDSGLAPELAQGLFATPSEHKVVMRLSTNAGDILPDTVSHPRGLALKILRRPGRTVAGCRGNNPELYHGQRHVFQGRTPKGSSVVLRC